MANLINTLMAKKNSVVSAVKRVIKKVTVKKTKKVGRKAVESDLVKVPGKGALDVSVKTGGKTYVGKTDDIGAFIRGLGLLTTNTATIVSVSAEVDVKVKGKKTVKKTRTVDKVFNVHKARRLFRHDLSAQLLDKTYKMALGV